MSQTPTAHCCQLCLQTYRWSRRCWCISLQAPYLFVLETSQNPSCLAFVELAVLVTFDGEHPSSCDVVLVLRVLADVNDLVYIILFPGLNFVLLGLKEFLGILLDVRW